MVLKGFKLSDDDELPDEQDGCVPVHHRIRAPWIRASLVCIPVSSIVLGRLPLVPVGNTGTIPYEMWREAADIPGASCDKTKDGKDCCRWWYVNSWAHSWETKQWWNEEFPKGSVAELVGRQAFCTDDEGSSPSGGTSNMKSWMIPLIGCWIKTSFCYPVVLFFWKFRK